MWLFTIDGFLSVVKNLNSTGPEDALLVRGRKRADLEWFADSAEMRGRRPEVFATPEADYPWRMTTSREVLVTYFAERVAALDYPNFKARVAEFDSHRAYVYGCVWRALLELPKGSPRDDDDEEARRAWLMDGMKGECVRRLKEAAKKGPKDKA